jgi:hypothetical protein
MTGSPVTVIPEWRGMLDVLIWQSGNQGGTAESDSFVPVWMKDFCLKGGCNEKDLS